jgi:beta-glucanase (GH16 family)
VLITPAVTRFYLNRREFWSTPTPPEYHQPMYVLANLAIGGGWPVAGLPSPQVMQIAYIKVFQKKPGKN